MSQCSGAGEDLKVNVNLQPAIFEIRDNGDGRRYAKMTHQEATKNHPGGEIEKENCEQEVQMYSVNSIFLGGEDPVGLLEQFPSVY